MTDFPGLSSRVFDCDPSIRSITFSRIDGALLHSEMRPGVESLNPVGEIERMESEVVVPTLSNYFESYKKYLGPVDYMGAKFERVSMLYMKHRNVFVIVSIEPNVSMSPIVQRIKEVLNEGFGDNSQI